MKVYWDWKKENNGPNVWKKIPTECPLLVKVQKIGNLYIMVNNKNFIFKRWFLSYVTEIPQKPTSLRPVTVRVLDREDVFP